MAGQFLDRTVYYGGYVLADPKVPAAVRERKPFVLAYPRCPASRCLAALADKIGPQQKVHQTGAGDGFLRRTLRWLV